MKFSRIAIAAMMLATAVSCLQELPSNEDMTADIKAPKLYAELEEDAVETRTCIDGAGIGEDKSLPLLWTPSDEVGVFSSGGRANVRYVNDETEVNVPNASFSATASVNGEITYVYYPYDAANDGKKAEALAGSIPAEQVMGEELAGDYKYGVPRSRTEDEGYRFKFYNLFSMVQINIDATGTDIAGQELESVTLTVTRDGNPVAVTGDFTFNAIKGEYTVGTSSNELKTVWNKPLQGSHSGFATIFADVKAGDKLTFAVRTTEYTTTFHVTSKVDFKPGLYYTFPMTLAKFAAKKDEYGYKTVARPTISSLKFEVAKNKGKLLDNQLVWNSSNNPQFNSVTSHTATVSDNEFSLMIPYLYDYKLVPTFSVANGAVVKVGNQTITSGTTEVDFTGGATLTVATAEDYRDYKVTLSNTGLPVVVLKQSSSGDFDKVYQGGVNIPLIGNVGGTLVNKFVDFMIRGKDTEWVEDDVLTIYNPDGSIDLLEAKCGAKLRGNTSQAYPKKPFAIKLVDKQPVLGMPKHKRWVLLANWLDHSMIRNTVAFDIAHAIENAWKGGAIEPGIPWNVHGKNVELVFIESNGEAHHVGNYLLCEQIKIDSKRLNITDPYEDVVEDGNANPGIADCGYLLEIDTNYDEVDKFKTSKQVPVMFKDEVSDAILNAVKTKIQGIETNLYNNNFTTAYNDLDINSVIDQMLIWELTMNREYGDPRSVYYFMDGNSKLCAGPVWDFDRGTFQNTTNAKDQGNSDRVKPYDRWMYWRTAEKETYSYIWYRQLVKDPTFQTTVQQRWAVIYPHLKLVSAQICEYGRTLKTSFEVDSKMWPTTKNAIQKHKSGFSDWSGDENINMWDDLIENFVTVYEARLEGMNTLITTGKFTE